MKLLSNKTLNNNIVKNMFRNNYQCSLLTNLKQGKINKLVRYFVHGGSLCSMKLIANTGTFKSLLGYV